MKLIFWVLPIIIIYYDYYLGRTTDREYRKIFYSQKNHNRAQFFSFSSTILYMQL